MVKEERKVVEKEFDERVVEINRVSRTVKGGRRIRFRALVVVGDKKGRVGLGIGKSGEVATAIQKATAQAKKRLVKIEISKADSVLHDARSTYGTTTVLLKPAPEGTSVIAGGTVRAVVEVVGIKNVVAKSIGSTNKINNARATIEALKKSQVK